ncbi:MAG: hypothetical protein H6974_11150 [Gammaproteobacteria bacterium]|nr:hypothetical protein [Gammaproteobacteria bacterium]
MAEYPVFTAADMHRAWDEAQQRHQALMAKPSVNLSALPAADKRRVWNHLQQIHPEVAALLQDPHVRDIRDTFAADVLISADLLQDLRDEHPD